MTKSERNFILFTVPSAVFYTVAIQLDFSGTLSQRAVFLQLYGFVIYTCCVLVVYKEYTDFFDVHERKDLFSDILILAGAAVGMRVFVAEAKDLTKAL